LAIDLAIAFSAGRAHRRAAVRAAGDPSGALRLGAFGSLSTVNSAICQEAKDSRPR
jgi:hypothetical protein